MSPIGAHVVRRRGAFSLIEAVLAIAILGVMTAAAMSTVAASRRAEQYSADRAQARALAEGLMSEVLSLRYREGTTILSLGLDLLELSNNRTSFDDIDDYDGYVDSPPKDRTGAAIAGLSAWSRSVKVDFVTPANLASTSLTETGMKRVVITVKKSGKVILKATAYRSLARESF